MSDFFEPPAQPREHEAMFRQPQWIGPPDNVVPGCLDLVVVLARTEEVGISVERFAVYPNGVEFEMLLRSHSGEMSWDIDDAMYGTGTSRRRKSDPTAGLPPERLRFGVRLADGSKVTNLRPGFPEGGEQPLGPVLMEHGGGGGQGRWHQGWWLWPLPPSGLLTLALEWPVAGIGFTSHDIDADLVRSAATRAQPLWAGEPPARWGGGPWFRAE